MSDLTDEANQDDEGCLADLLAFIESGPDTGGLPSPVCEPIPPGQKGRLPADNGEASYVFDILADWQDEQRGLPAGIDRMKCWWACPAPLLIAGIRDALLEMPPILPGNPDLNSYDGVNEVALVHADELTVLQEDALISMRVLFMLQLRDLHPSEYERTMVRISDVLQRMRRELPIWRKQMAEQRISINRTRAQSQAVAASKIYSDAARAGWGQRFDAMRSANPRLTANSAATRIAAELGLPETAIQTIRKHLGRRNRAKKM